MITAVLVTFVTLFVPAFSAVVILRVVLSYLMRPGNRLLEMLSSLTEPVLAPIRKVLPATGGVDFAPLVALMLLQALQALIVNLIAR